MTTTHQTLLGDTTIEKQLVGTYSPANTRYLVLSPENLPSTEWVHRSAAALLSRFREDLLNGSFESRTLVVSVFARPESEQDEIFQGASVQALRGIIQSVTRELGTGAPPINLLVLKDSQISDAAHALELFDTAAGAFTAGYTMDLTKDAGK